MEGALVERNFRALSLFRIVFAIYLLGDFLAYYGCCFGDFFGEAGVLPSAASYADPDLAARGFGSAFVALLDRANVLLVLPIAYPVAIVCLGVGAWTRLSNLVVLILNSYLYFRNPYIMSGADSLARLMLIWCLFLPLGWHWSIDALNDASLQRRDYPTLPFLAIKVQVCSVYLLGALTKLSGGPWREGQAIIWVLSDNVWAGGPYGLYFVEHSSSVLVCANYLIILFQLCFPLLIASPWRNSLTRGVALVGAAAMHLSFILLLNIGNFPFISLTVLLVFVPDAWLARAWEALRAMAGTGMLQWPLPTASSALAGARRTASASSASTLACGSLLLPMGGGKGGGATASPHRVMISTIRARARPDVWLCGFLALLALTSNIHSILLLKDKEGSTDPAVILREIDRLASLLQVAQRWYLFAPIPTQFQWDFRIFARSTDGATRDLMQGAALPLPHKQADRGAIEFASYRWRKYFTRIDDFAASGWAALGDFLCRRAQKDVASPVRVVEFIASRRAVEPATSKEPPTISHTFACQT